MKFSRDKDIDDKARELVRAGWTAEKRGAHWRLRHPNGVALTVPGTPSDHRAALNFMADVRRAERRAVERKQGGWVLSIYFMMPALFVLGLVLLWIFQTLVWLVIVPSAVP